MATPTYPLSLDGPLCPLLNDGALILKFYEGSGAKPEVKKFIKRNRWPGKPPLSYSVGPETMKKMLLSLNGSREARTILANGTAKLDNAPVLYQVIWNWLTINDAKLVQAVDEHSHTENELVFMSPEELNGLIDAQLADEAWSEERKLHLVYLVLAFAMLQPADAPHLLQVLAERFGEFKHPLGIG